jgi:hypothetical protein
VGDLRPRARRAGRGLLPAREPIEIRSQAMRINLASVLVDDQEKALAFYTEVLGL